MVIRLKNTDPIGDGRRTDYTLQEWSEISGIPLATLYGRLKRGWPIEEVFYRKTRYAIKNPTKFDPKIKEKVGVLKTNEDLIDFVQR